MSTATTMKILSLFLVTSCFVYYSNQQSPDANFSQEHDDAKAACIKESGATSAEVNGMTLQTWQNPDQKLKCYEKCMFLKFGVIDQTGEVVDDGLQDYMENFFNSTTEAAITKACSDAEGPDKSDLCSVAFALIKCITQYSGK